MTAPAKVATKEIGRTGIRTYPLGFGCMSLTPGFYGDAVDQNETEKVLDRAIELQAPVTLSTADFYTSMSDKSAIQQNIKLIGRVLKNHPRDSAIIAMKWGPWVNPGAGFAQPDYSPTALRKRVGEALDILGVKNIDILVWRLGTGKDPKTSVEETAKAFKALVEEGKISAVGVSEASPDEMRTIHAIVPISVIELEWSLFARDCLKEIVPLGREMGASFLAYSPLGRGLLTGKLDVSQLDDTDFRKNHQPRFKEGALDKNQQLALKVAQLAQKKGCSPGQLALAWVLAQGDDVIPIPGTKRIKYLEENVGALNVKLTKEEVEELSAMIPEDEVVGDRY